MERAAAATNGAALNDRNAELDSLKQSQALERAKSGKDYEEAQNEINRLKVAAMEGVKQHLAEKAKEHEAARRVCQRYEDEIAALRGEVEKLKESDHKAHEPLCERTVIEIQEELNHMTARHDRRVLEIKDLEAQLSKIAEKAGRVCFFYDAYYANSLIVDFDRLRLCIGELKEALNQTGGEGKP